MILSKEAYLQELGIQLKKVENKEELLQEFDLHLSEMLFDLQEMEGLNEEEAMAKVLDRFGTPLDVASTYKDELDVTPKKMQWTFISINLLFFFVGICLTIVYNLLPLEIVGIIWGILTSITTLLILLYMFFWVLLGYEIGKEFGLGGKRLLRKTFYFALAPNLILMGLVLFGMVPFTWFDPLLTPTFILVCILCTIILYPISYAAFRWGTIRSI